MKTTALASIVVVATMVIAGCGLNYDRLDLEDMHGLVHDCQHRLPRAAIGHARCKHTAPRGCGALFQSFEFIIPYFLFLTANSH